MNVATLPPEEVGDPPQPETPAKPEPRPFDVVEAAEQYIKRTIDRAEDEEATVTAKVIQQRSKVARFSIALARLKGAEKDLKDRLESEVEVLDAMERHAEFEIQQKRIQPDLPFDEAAQAARDAWKTLPIRDVLAGVKAGVIDKLVEAMVVTFEQLEAWRSTGKPEVKGIGEVARQAIDDAVVKWWEAHPAGTAPTPVAPVDLAWEEHGDGERWTALNTAGVNDPATGAPHAFTIHKTRTGYVVDNSSDALLPVKYPEKFPSIEAAQDYCGARNLDLCDKARDQMPEAFGGAENIRAAVAHAFPGDDVDVEVHAHGATVTVSPKGKQKAEVSR